jgi:hypothetical protein
MQLGRILPINLLELPQCINGHIPGPMLSRYYHPVISEISGNKVGSSVRSHPGEKELQMHFIHTTNIL